MDWLARYILPNCGLEAYKSVWRGDGRAVVTNGSCLLAVDDPAATFAPLAVPFTRPESNGRLRAILSAPPPADALVTDLPDLWAWLDRLVRERCGPCAGTGKAFHLEAGHPPRFVACDDCDGRGWHLSFPEEPVDRDTVAVCGVPVDRNAVAWWLAGELADLGESWACRVWAAVPFPPAAGSVAEPVPVVTFAGDHWRVSVAGFDRGAHSGRYRAYHPGAGSWWAARRCETARLAAADWCQDRDIDPADLFAGVT